MIEVTAPTVELRALTWGPDDGPMALCLHGFPDTAHGWRALAPHLVDAGYRVVAPFMRGYAPSSVPADGAANIEAVMDDALRVRAALGPSDRDVLIGHDWGALAASGIAALPDKPFAKVVVMSVPPPAAFNPFGRVRDRGRLLARLPAQLLRSSYMFYFQLPWLPEHSARWVVPLLWRRWSPGYDASTDIAHVRDALGDPANWRAALATYRATIRDTTPLPRYRHLHRSWISDPIVPVLYLHGADDGCMTADFTRWVSPILPTGSRAAIVEGAGHFLALEQPEAVGSRILEFIGPVN
ncbi:MAG: alpha/beta fold hydrolase [Mycobacterium sp.]|nr:alpha/beta fold hydrolase [Mycobacterium sp.]